MRKTLVINAGSSSIKFKLYTMPGYSVDCEGIVDRVGLEMSSITIEFNDKKVEKELKIENHEVGISKLLELLEENNLISNKEEITKIGHRVVQGGEIFKESTVVGDKELEQIYELSKLAPLHNTPNGDGIKVFQKLLPDSQNVAVFDTEFHQTMPKESFMYPVPYSWYTEFNVRRYGMHGTSHKYISAKLAKLENNDSLKIINCHLGNGASICAIDSGKSIHTSMGLTPLAGLMMGTRSGDIDPSILEYMNKQTGMSVEEITSKLNKESGMLGISGLSSDFRDIESAMEAGHERAILGMDIYVTRIIETIGAYYARLGGLDIISFTGGIGENSSVVRREVLNGLSAFGLEIDEEINSNRKLVKNNIVTTKDSKIKSWVLATDEEYQIALEAEKF